MQIDERTHNRLPAHLQAIFSKLHNPGKETVLAEFAKFGESKSSDHQSVRRSALGRMNDDGWQPSETIRHGVVDSGSPARFFASLPTTEADIDAARMYYTAKAGADRMGTTHPTTKPLSLISWLCKLITPSGGVIIDPFCGSGTTVAAAIKEGFSAIGIEKEKEYYDFIMKRISHISGGDMPLFSTIKEPDLFSL